MTTRPPANRPPTPIRLWRRLRARLLRMPLPRPLALYERARWLRQVKAPEPEKILARWSRAAPAPGEPAPDFSLDTPAGETLCLSEVLAAKPVVLIFGSYT